MQNTLKNENESMLFDLKGSLYKRIVPFKEKWWLTKKSNRKCMKDLNYLEIFKGEKKALDIDYSKKIQLESIIMSDSMFLRSCNLIDYSLLIGIEPR
jgi:hypothetical protein